jgi:integrase
MLSLATRRYREAEHRAALVDEVFRDAWERALSVAGAKGTDLGPILRGYLQEVLERDLHRRMERPPGSPVYAHWWEPGDPGSATEADLQAIRNARAGLAHDLATNSPTDLEEEAARRLRRYELPEHLLRPLTLGLLEATIRAWDVAERRTLGTEPLVFSADDVPVENTPQGAADVVAETRPALQEPSPKPLASSLVEPFFARREMMDRATHQVIGQDRGTLRRFLEACGDQPVDAYRRGDVTQFLNTLRRLPKTYGKSPRDKDRSLSDIIAEADTKGAERLTDRTVKRHLSALSQFFQFAVDAGHLTVAARGELVDEHRFRDDRGAREQRDAWTSEELRELFASPVWAGCSSADRRSLPGPHIIRDAKFWLPILALFHGARLEEFADLYHRDLGRDGDTWFVRIAAEGRRLKNKNAERTVPLHPEVIRLGFLEYVASTARRLDDPLFPDIAPQGKDRKRGARFTRFFVNYRQQIGLYREGVGMHAFRHTANTRLRDAIADWQQERHVAYLFGHSQGGGEGRERYDKGPGLKAAAATLALLRYPEIDVSRHYVREPGNFEPSWGENESRTA